MELDPDDPAILEKALEIVVEASEKAVGLPIEEQISDETDVVSRFRDDIRLAREGKDGWGRLMFEGPNAINDLTSIWPAEVRDPLIRQAYPFLTRYVNSTPLLLAEKIDEYMNAGLVELSPVYFDEAIPDDEGWMIGWKDGRSERFDFLISCAGFEFPRFPMAGESAISVSDSGAVADGPMSTIGADLRVRFQPGGEPEHIWVLGPGLRVIRPIAHIAYLAAQESAEVAEQIASLEAPAALSGVPSR